MSRGLKAKHMAERKAMRAALAGDGVALDQVAEMVGEGAEAALLEPMEPDVTATLKLECEPFELGSERVEVIIERIERIERE